MSDGKKSSRTFAEHYNEQVSRSSGSGFKRAKLDSDDELKSRVMEEDPMINYFKERESKEKGLPDIPKSKFKGPPNRYNIKPGHWWDGVDRSNGFERKLLAKEAAKNAGREESYRDATRDL